MELWMQPASARSGQGECQQLVDHPGTARTASTGTEDACQRQAHTQHLAGSVATAAQQHHLVPQHATPAPCHPTAAAVSHMQAASSQKRVAQHLMQHSVRSMRRTLPGLPMGTPCSKPCTMRAAKRARKSRLGPAGQATPAQGILGHTCGQHDPLTPRDCNAEPQAPRARRSAACHVANPFAWTPEPSPPPEPTPLLAPFHVAAPAAGAPAPPAAAWDAPWGLPPPPTSAAPDPGRAFLLHALLPRPLFQAQPTPAILAAACPLAPAAPLAPAGRALAGQPAGLLGLASPALAGQPAGLLGADALARLTSGTYLAGAPRAARRLVFDGPDAADADAGAAAAAPIAALGDDERAVSPSPRAMWCGNGGDLSPAASRCSAAPAAAAAPAAPSGLAVSAVPEPVPEPEPCTPVGPRPQAATATLFDPTEAHTLDQLHQPIRIHTPLMGHWGAGGPAGAGLLPVPRAPQKPPPQLDSFLGLGLRVRVGHKPLPPAELRITPVLLGSPASCC